MTQVDNRHARGEFDNGLGEMIKVLVLSICLCALVPSVMAQGISVSQSLSSFNIAYEDSVLFEIELKWEGPQSAYLFGRPLNPAIDGMIVRAFSSSVFSSGDGSDEITTKQYRYVLAPISSGPGQIASVNISYLTWPDSLPGELSTEPMTGVIAEPLPPPPERDWSLLYWLVGAFLVVGSVGTIVLWRRSRNQRPTESVRTVVERFLDDLQVLKADSGDDHKKFQTGLYRILAEFFKEQYGLKADELAEEQLAKELLDAGLSEQARQRITA
ncbi:MAG: hypothetical protein KAW46_09115, partial [candidate division Zixibacteria bacterium]|nr:hypothetical protein [candidate division Zixibacteria bacterium]